jgi:polyferredoxin
VGLVLSVGAALVWLHVGVSQVARRVLLGQPYGLLLVIMLSVFLLALLSAWLFVRPSAGHWAGRAQETATVSASSFALSALLLGMVQAKVPRPMLLLERFWPSGGWFEVLLLSVYAAWLAAKLLGAEARQGTAATRLRLWTFFSAVFFGQLLLGLLGFERFLMSGELHLPVPALIVAGPLFRGTRFFMLGLFGATVLLVGPAWCSHLCYLGAFDGLAARARRPTRTPAWSWGLRLGLMVLVFGLAFALGRLGVSALWASVLALLFGAGGVLLMMLWSRRSGRMMHCTLYCPIGVLAVVLGKLSPFRIRLSAACSRCGACTPSCRYGALEPAHLQRGRVGLSCTLCGDCVERCGHGALSYSFLGRSGAGVRVAFVALVVALHAAFLGVARL